MERERSRLKSSDMKKINAVIWLCATVLTGLILLTTAVLATQITENIFGDFDIIFLVPDEPGIEMGDDKGGWQNQDTLDVFKAEYNSALGEAVISSNTGDAIFAPGASVSYSFKIKNNGNVAMDYNVLIDFAFLKNNADFGMENSPLQVRLFKKDGGVYIVGDKDSFVSVSELGEYYDSGVLGINCYNEYDLEIFWLFENGNDQHDTWLASLSADENVHFALDISTHAEQNPVPDAKGGILDPTAPQIRIGGNVNPVPLIILIALTAGYAGTLVAAALVKKSKSPGTSQRKKDKETA